jgi:hypothetical protein
MNSLKIETAWHELGKAWLLFSKWHPSVPTESRPEIFLPVITANWEGLEEIYKEFCKEFPKVSEEPTHMDMPQIFLFSDWQKADEKWLKVTLPVQIRTITPFQPQIKTFGTAEAKWQELIELFATQPELIEPEEVNLELEDWWEADRQWDRFTENERKLESRKPPRFITPFHGRFFDWLKLERIYEAILTDVPKPKSNSHSQKLLPTFEFRKWWEAERLFGLITHWQPPHKLTKNETTPSQFIFSNWAVADQAYKGIMIPMPSTTDDSMPIFQSLTIEEAAKPPRQHAWQSLSQTSRNGAENWPTRQAKKNRPLRGGSMQVGRWAISTRLFEGVKERSTWYGKTKRVWVTKKVAEMTQLDWVECLMQAEGNTKLAEKLFHNQTRWVVGRINPATRSRWELRNEWHEKRNGLERTNGCKKPWWLDKDEHSARMSSEFGQMLESTTIADSTPGNPDLRAKFQNKI